VRLTRWMHHPRLRVFNSSAGAVHPAVEYPDARHRPPHVDTLRRLALALAFRDRQTAAHLMRIGLYAGVLASRLGLPRAEAERIRYASHMHDIGKVGIPDAILLKPSALTSVERKIMERHTTIGAFLLGRSSVPILRVAERIARSHHERWDGHGYPDRLGGDEIPLAGRICAVVDTFDALTTDRRYQRAQTNDTAYQIMAAERGRHFDPRILDAFLDHRRHVEAVQRRYVLAEALT
jgi:putative two-component system response regulator